MLEQSTLHVPAKRPAASVAGADRLVPSSKPIKRRASKACQSCRARKVRCNVVEQSPCTNCRLDQVPCIVSESKRKRKARPDSLSAHQHAALHPSIRSAPPVNSSSTSSFTRPLLGGAPLQSHVPHSLYRVLGDRTMSIDPALASTSPANSATPGSVPRLPSQPLSPRGICPTQLLPQNIRPLPPKLAADEIDYLNAKTALHVPDNALRNALLHGYLEFVHPFMPVLDLIELFDIIEHPDGSHGRISLLLLQSIMFAGTAFVDTKHLRQAGFASRREARKRFYQRARLLYDFDCETDRMTLVQALLLMTFWYEMPDDLKDTWHWMGLAASFAQTIGLNRDPARSSMSLKRQRQWKRVWWSCVMRDRLIALGMRRPTRIKAEDSDVPMLTLDDFDVFVVPDAYTCIPKTCSMARDVEMQRSLARTCIEKAKLCVCISHVLSSQYSVTEQGTSALSDEGMAQTTTVLLPKKLDPERSEVKACHRELLAFYEALPQDVRWSDSTDDRDKSGSEEQQRRHTHRNEAPLIVNKALLHMIYFTTLSALHRPQVLAEAAVPQAPASSSEYEALESSRSQVRVAAKKITDIARELLRCDFVRYLPTTGVTVLQPAIITHLLDIKLSNDTLRTGGLRGFCECIQVMGKLGESYAAADFSLALIEAAVRKADIQLPTPETSLSVAASSMTLSPRSNSHVTYQWRKAWSTSDLIDAGVEQRLIARNASSRPLTPPPDVSAHEETTLPQDDDRDMALKLESFLASTPPESELSSSSVEDQSANGLIELDFAALLNVDEMGDGVGKDGLGSMQGESSGFTFDMDWLTSIKDHDALGMPTFGSASEPECGGAE